ncbi:MAG: radical SAM protein [Spirochaetes bacterium]|nr:radical SAM protein [Spirochaetota bacterium]
MRASYVSLYENGGLERIAGTLRSQLKQCRICPHECRADRTSGAGGMCRTGMNPVVSSFNAHFGEESCLVGRKGSGTIFFANCNLSCVFCQNYDISHLGRGEEISFRELSDIMLLLQSRGCHNINFVTPTHMVSAIVTALSDAVPRGLTVPLVYNSGGYDSTDTLRMLSGVFDIYMPDLKFMDSGTAGTLCGAQDYPERAADAVREMHDQVGDLVIDERGIAVKGLLVRHLVLPNNLAGTDGVISFIAGLSKNTYLNLMDQYRPEHRAGECFDLKRRVTLQEFDDAVRAALDAGIKRIDCLNR